MEANQDFNKKNFDYLLIYTNKTFAVYTFDRKYWCYSKICLYIDDIDVTIKIFHLSRFNSGENNILSDQLKVIHNFKYRFSKL